MANIAKTGDLRAAVHATSCPFRRCPAHGIELADRGGAALSGVFLEQEGRSEDPPVTSIVFGVPKDADLDVYREFTHLYLPAPTEYLVPHRSWILLRHQGGIRYAKRVEWATYNERRRRSEDPNYESNRGSKLMAPGHVVAVGPSVPIRRAFRWLDARYADGLVPGSILDPRGGEPFRWQLSMIVRTADKRRQAARPFTVIRRSDLMVPVSSSRPERALRDNLVHAGVGVCKHLRTMQLPTRSVAPDIAIPELRTVVEYDGAYWHHGGTKHARDIAKSSLLLDAGWKVVRIREAGLERLQFKRSGFRQISISTATTSQEMVATVLRLLAN